MVFISSEFEELAEVCRRVKVLVEGRFVSELTEDEVTVQNLISACYAEAAPVAPVIENAAAAGA